MLTLRDLKKRKDEGTIRVKIDFEDPDDEGVFVSMTTDWKPILALADVGNRTFSLGHISLDEQLVRLSDGRIFKLNELCLYVNVEGTYKRSARKRSSKRERQARREWEKIKQQLKKCGFTYQHGQPEWFNTWENGKF